MSWPEVWLDGEWSEKYLCLGHVDEAVFLRAAKALDEDYDEHQVGPVIHRWMRWKDTEPHEVFRTVLGTCFGTAHPYTEAQAW